MHIVGSPGIFRFQPKDDYNPEQSRQLVCRIPVAHLQDWITEDAVRGLVTRTPVKNGEMDWNCQNRAGDALASQETTHVQETTDVQATTNVQGGMNVQEAKNDHEPADVQETTDVEESTNTPEAMDVQEGTVLHSLCGRTVVRLGDNLVVKSGHLRPQEGEALRFIAANKTIPVPKVHDIRWKDGKVVALVMDYIPGKRLDESWKTLDSNQKLSIAKELRSYMNQLRELKRDYIGAVGRGKAISRKVWTSGVDSNLEIKGCRGCPAARRQLSLAPEGSPRVRDNHESALT